MPSVEVIEGDASVPAADYAITAMTTTTSIFGNRSYEGISLETVVKLCSAVLR